MEYNGCIPKAAVQAGRRMDRPKLFSKLRGCDMQENEHTLLTNQTLQHQVEDCGSARPKMRCPAS